MISRKSGKVKKKKTLEQNSGVSYWFGSDGEPPLNRLSRVPAMAKFSMPSNFEKVHRVLPRDVTIRYFGKIPSLDTSDPSDQNERAQSFARSEMPKVASHFDNVSPVFGHSRHTYSRRTIRGRQHLERNVPKPLPAKDEPVSDSEILLSDDFDETFEIRDLADDECGSDEESPFENCYPSRGTTLPSDLFKYPRWTLSNWFLFHR